MGEFIFIESGGKKYVVHPNKGGFVFVYDRNAKVQNVYRGVDNINFVKDIDPKTGDLIGRRDMSEGKHTNLCPAISGGYSWPSGTYYPKTGLFYRVGFEWCEDFAVVKTSRLPNPSSNSISEQISPCMARAKQASWAYPCPRSAQRQSTF